MMLFWRLVLVVCYAGAAFADVNFLVVGKDLRLHQIMFALLHCYLFYPPRTGDWGGIEMPPYTTPGQTATGKHYRSMAIYLYQNLILS